MRVDAATMEPDELRGYVRACALPIVGAFVRQLLTKHPEPYAQQFELVSMAVDRTVQQVVRDLQSPPVIAIPAPHVLRRAA
jgi:hypothetical protein